MDENLTGCFRPPDDLATKANIIIDPAEIQAASMDDLDEDEESGAAQVGVVRRHLGLFEPVWVISSNAVCADLLFCGDRGRSVLRRWEGLW